MKKILVLGSSGMLGHVVYNYLSTTNKYELVHTSFSNQSFPHSHSVDVTDRLALELFIKSVKPDIVINCVGVLINGSTKDPSNAIHINACLPHILVKLMRQIGGRLIHISTDCVFSGEKGNYVEADFADATDIYGRSKALGEVDNDSDLTLRTSIVGPELKENGEGLFHWFMRQKGDIKGYSKVFWSGVTTLELAKIIDEAIKHNLVGLINITNGDKLTKFELLKLFKLYFNKNMANISPSDSKQGDKSLKSIRSDFKYQYPTYSNMIKDQFHYMNSHRDIYTRLYDY